MKITPMATALLLFGLCLPVRAGPPFVSDNPVPVKCRCWEIDLGSTIIDTGQAVFGTAPELEADYGLFPNVQTHLLARFAFYTPSASGRRAYGPGDFELGVKYRFVQEASGRPQVGTYPLVQVPLGDSSRGLGLGVPQLFLPIWLQKSFGSWIVTGGGGYYLFFPESSANPDAWFFGLAGQHSLFRFLILGAELYTLTDQPGFGKAETAFDIGGDVTLRGRHHLLFTAGRDITGINLFYGYVAYQYVLWAGAGTGGRGSRGNRQR